MYPKVTLKSGRAGAVSAGHPWVFSGAVESVEPEAEDGGVVTVAGPGGHFIGHGYYNSQSSIRVRVFSRREDETIDRDFWRERFRQAIGLREAHFDPERTDAYRLVNAEGDRLPGLVVDRYADCVVVQVHTLGMETQREAWLPELEALTGPACLVERSDLTVRKREGLRPLPPRILSGSLPVSLDGGGLAIRENGLRYRVDLLGGQKTGFYLDQRDNRATVGAMANGRRVLNGFAYTGGFSIAALHGGASHVTSVETSAPALALLEENLRLNGLDATAHRAVNGGVVPFLEQGGIAGERYDLIVLDPPAFVKHRPALQAGLKGYRRLNRLALRLLPPGGILATASCSSHVTAGEWEDLVRSALREEGRSAQLLQATGHPLDHPVHLDCPEGRYLKCLFLRLLD